jgi:hypothetical protein
VQPVGIGNSGQGLAPRHVAELADRYQFRMRSRHEMKNPDAPVRRVWMPLDQSEGLKFVYDATKCDRLHVKELR